jgi:uracil phosphoribosyltransferase
MTHFRAVQNPLLRDRITALRNKNTTREEFVLRVEQIATLLAHEAGHFLATQTITLETPLEKTEGTRIARPIVLIPILRAGLGMLRAFQAVYPEAAVGHLGLVRDHATLEARVYLEKLPPVLAEATVLVLDPMLATGHSSKLALDRIRQAGAKEIKFICCIAAPEGVAHLEEHHPDVPVLAGALDRQLNEKGYILPGLGDAGDRQFGTI